MHFNDSKAFIEFSNNIDDIYENIEEYNLNKGHKILIVLDDVVVYNFVIKKLNPIVTELFTRRKKTKHFSCFYYTILCCCNKEY